MPLASVIQVALDQAVTDGVFPGAVLAVRHRGEQPDIYAAGRISSEQSAQAVDRRTIYDLASLTKPLSTVTAIVLLIQEGRCRLHERVDVYLPELTGRPIGTATLWHLLTHCSGLPGWRGYYERVSQAGVLPASERNRAAANVSFLEMIGAEPLIYERGARSLYSDLGFMLLGMVVTRCGARPLDRVFLERIARAAHAETLEFVPAEDRQTFLACAADRGIGVAPTEIDSWRGRLLCGEVHDENAASLGGVAGHAGLFGSVEGVLAVTGAWLQARQHRDSFLDCGLVKEFTERQRTIPGASWALGWDTPSPPSSGGRFISEASFGHLGYTGTSIWIDPKCELEMVLLSNRVHPTRKNERIKTFRPLIHELIYREYQNRS
ncbi:MAG: serine hydrolase [Nitrospira sp.]